MKMRSLIGTILFSAMLFSLSVFLLGLSGSSAPKPFSVSGPDPTMTPPADETSQQIIAIDAYCDEISSGIKKDEEPDLVAADVSDGDSEWRLFGSSEELEKFRETTETYFIAYSWLKGDVIEQTDFTIFSQSGDWVKYVSSCYRHNGSLARVGVDYRTFYGYFKMDRTIHFLENGETLADVKKYFDLKTDEPKNAEEYRGDNMAMLYQHHFMTTKDLPYAGLLNPKRED
jgi:hypothetical protein